MMYPSPRSLEKIQLRTSMAAMLITEYGFRLKMRLHFCSKDVITTTTTTTTTT